MGVQRVFVGIDGRGPGAGGERLADHGQGVWSEHVVVVEEQGDVRRRQRERGVGGPRHPLRLGMGGEPDAWIRRGLLQHLAHGRRACVCTASTRAEPCRHDWPRGRPGEAGCSMSGLRAAMGLGPCCERLGRRSSAAAVGRRWPLTAPGSRPTSRGSRSSRISPPGRPWSPNFPASPC